MYLRSFSVNLVCTTSVRAPKGWPSSGYELDKSESISIFEDKKGLMLPMTKRVDLRDHYYTPSRDDDSIFKISITPFRTYNICRSHSLQVTLTVQCTDKEITTEFKSEAVEVIPGANHIENAKNWVPVPKLSENLEKGKEKDTSSKIKAKVKDPADEQLPQYEANSVYSATSRLQRDNEREKLSEKEQEGLAEEKSSPSPPLEYDGPSSSHRIAPSVLEDPNLNTNPP